MNKAKTKKRNERRRNRRLSWKTLALAMMVLAIAAITVVSRQKMSFAERGKTQMAEKANSGGSKAANQDQSLTTEPQELTTEEAQKLADGMKELVNQSTEGLHEVHHADGTTSVDLQGRFQNVTVARINKDGSISQSCVDNPRAAGAFLGIDPKMIDNNADTTGAKPIKTNSKPRN